MTTGRRGRGRSGCINGKRSCGSCIRTRSWAKRELGADGLLSNIVTDGGKTAIIAAVTAWLRIAHGVPKFVMLCPNLIVRDRLEEDFGKGKVFQDRDILPDWANCGPSDFVLTTLGADKPGGWASLFSASVVMGYFQRKKTRRSFD